MDAGVEVEGVVAVVVGAVAAVVAGAIVGVVDATEVVVDARVCINLLKMVGI